MTLKLPVNRVILYSQIKMVYEFQGLLGPQKKTKTFTINKEEINFSRRKLAMDDALKGMAETLRADPTSLDLSTSYEGLAKSLVAVINALASIIEEGSMMSDKDTKRIAHIVYNLGGELEYSSYKARENRRDS